MKKIFLVLSSLCLVNMVFAKIVPKFEKQIVDNECIIYVIGWYDDRDTPNNSADDVLVEASFFRRCN